MVGRKRRFFAATAPGLEKVCRDELNAILPTEMSTLIVDGGVEFKGRLYDCYLANLYLHMANRILMRIDSFHAANFRQLEKNLIAVPWELFLMPSVKPRVHVASRHSRLYHKAAVAERIQASIAFHFSEDISSGKSAPASTDTQQIFVRISDNHFTLSIDSSGELLHKRGIKLHRASAPLRETLAAAAAATPGQ